MEVRIGRIDSDQVVINVRRDPDPGDADGWLECEIGVKAGAWSGRFAAWLQRPDFPHFRKQLDRFRHDPLTIAVFETLEGQLKLQLKGDRRGHILVSGIARDVAGTGNKLEFKFELDQSYLPELIEELKLIEQQFPAPEMQ